MTDQMIPADKVREIIHVNTFRRVVMPHCRASIIDQLDALLPAPPLPTRPTLADMTLEERDECTGMQADLAQGDRVVILDGTPDHDGLVQVLEKSLDVYRPSPEDVTPRPDLTRLEWPGDQKPAPAPALPGGWRLADHPFYGRVIVTKTTPSRDGHTYFVCPSRDRFGFDWSFCDHSELTYIDRPTTKGDGTPTGPAHLAVGTVIESADDHRIDALPVGSILLDRDEEAAIKGRGDWTGEGYIPIAGDGSEFGPWTVLHIPKEKA